MYHMTHPYARQEADMAKMQKEREKWDVRAKCTIHFSITLYFMHSTCYRVRNDEILEISEVEMSVDDETVWCDGTVYVNAYINIVYLIYTYMVKYIFIDIYVYTYIDIYIYIVYICTCTYVYMYIKKKYIYIYVCMYVYVYLYI